MTARYGFADWVMTAPIDLDIHGQFVEPVKPHALVPVPCRCDQRFACSWLASAELKF